MAKRLTIPRFASHEEEANWYDSHRKELDDDMVRRIDSGDFFVKLASSGDRLTSITIRMNPADLKAIRAQAAEKGIPYQTYIRVLLRDAVRRARRAS